MVMLKDISDHVPPYLTFIYLFIYLPIYSYAIGM